MKYLYRQGEFVSIVKKVKAENAEIHWGDETGIGNTSQDGRSYVPKGETPVRKTMAKRISLNMEVKPGDANDTDNYLYG